MSLLDQPLEKVHLTYGRVEPAPFDDNARLAPERVEQSARVRLELRVVLLAGRFVVVDVPLDKAQGHGALIRQGRFSCHDLFEDVGVVRVSVKTA